MQETQVRSLGLEDPLEKGMATHSSILAWRISWTEEAGDLSVHGVAKSQTQLSNWHMWTHNIHSKNHACLSQKCSRVKKPPKEDTGSIYNSLGLKALQLLRHWYWEVCREPSSLPQSMIRAHSGRGCQPLLSYRNTGDRYQAVWWLWRRLCPLCSKGRWFREGKALWQLKSEWRLKEEAL